VKPLHVAAYIEQLGRERSAPTVKQRLVVIALRVSNNAAIKIG
jgi:hypothetical protein